MRLIRKIRFGCKIFSHKITGIGIMLTRQCNLRCKYCNTIKDDNGIHLNVAQWKKIIDKFIRNGHLQFVFTGGEPLLYEGVFELIDYTYDKAMTSLITNGVLLNESNIRQLSRLDFLNISLDDINEDTISEKFDVSKLGLISDFSKRFDVRVCIITCVTAKNVTRVAELIETVSKYEFDFLISPIHSNKGRYVYRGYNPELEFRTEEDFKHLKDLQSRLLHMKAQGRRIAESNDFIKDMSNYAKNKFRMWCLAGEDYFCINNDGYIMACHDTMPSDVNALEFSDYEEMKKSVKKPIPKDCNCFYDCYYNRALFKKNPVKFLREVGLRRT